MIEACFSGICQCKSNWKSHEFNCMTTLNTNLNTSQFEPSPLYMNSDKVLENVGHSSYEFGSWIKRDVMMMTKHQGPFGKLSAISHDQSPILATNLYSTEQQCTPAAEVDCRLGAPSPQGRNFIIFDKTGDETRLILSSLGSPALRNQTDLASLRIPGHQARGEENLDARFMTLEAPISCEKSNENHTINDDEGTDYHEDTDEINALLDSDSEDYNGANCDVGDEDEVSTGHSPLGMEEVGFENGDDIEEDDANSLDIFPKRQKLLDYSFIKSSTSVGSRRVETSPPGLLLLHEEESVVDSTTSNLDSTTRGPILGNNKRVRNEEEDKILHTLKVLEKLVPGPTTTTRRRRRRKDPLMIIDQAIEYLKYLKVKAGSQSLGDDTESSSFFGAQC